MLQNITTKKSLDRNISRDSNKSGQTKQKDVEKHQSSRKSEQVKLSRRSLDKKQRGENNDTRSSSKAQHRRDDDLDSNKFADANVKVELTGEDDKFYDATEDAGAVMVKKSKAIATLPDGSKYPCVIVQKKSKTEGGSRKTSSENISDAKLTDTPPKKAARTFKNYTPVEMKMKPDWFDDLKIREEVKKPRPTSIIDGVLYTSRALIEESNTKLKQQKLNTFNLIEPEVFETYDVCKNVSESYEKVPKVD